MELTIQMHERTEPLRVKVLSKSDQGHRDSNQDSLGHSSSGPWWCAVLADGAGGHEGGGVASSLAVSSILNSFRACKVPCASQLQVWVRAANDNLLQVQQQRSELADMHTTLVVCLVNQQTRIAVWAHVGDSRIYHFHEERCLSKTRDHSVAQWMAEHKPGHDSPARNSLYTALGEPQETLQVSISSPVSLQPGDWLLLCSDGLWEYFNDDELGLLGHQLRGQSFYTSHLHELALSRAHGRADNLSSLSLFFDLTL
jgi:PPM family protein phosphatase